MIGYREYIEQTQPITRRLFDSLGEYREMLRETLSPVAVIRHTGEDDFHRKYQEWRQQPEIQEQFNHAEEARIRLDGQFFSMHVASGSIIHIAYQAIKLYSAETQFPDEYAHLLEGVNHGIPTITRFAVGRDVWGIPLGLLIYAGRNQYNHMDDGENLKRINLNIFNALARYEHEEFGYLNPAFELNNEHLDTYSTNIMSALDWDSYDAFLEDINRSLPDA